MKYSIWISCKWLIEFSPLCRSSYLAHAGREIKIEDLIQVPKYTSKCILFVLFSFNIYQHLNQFRNGVKQMYTADFQTGSKTS